MRNCAINLICVEKKNKHLDIKEQLTDANIKQMSWLLLYKMSKSGDKKSKVQNENKDINDLIFRKKDFKRDLNSKINSETLSKL